MATPIDTLINSIDGLQDAVKRLIDAQERAEARAASAAKVANAPQQVSTLGDYIRETGSLTGAIQAMVRSLEAKNKGKGIKGSPLSALFMAKGGQGIVGNVSRGLIHSARAKQFAGKQLRDRAAKASAAGRTKTAAKLTSKAAGIEAGAGLMKFAGWVGIAATAANEFGKQVVQATDQQISAMKQFAQMSASMAAVMAQRDIKEMQRSMSKGNDLAESAGALVESEQRRKDATAPIEVLLDKIYNQMLDGANKLLSDILEPVGEAAQALMDWLPANDQSKKDSTPQTTSQLLDRTYTRHAVRVAMGFADEREFFRRQPGGNEGPKFE